MNNCKQNEFLTKHQIYSQIYIQIHTDDNLLSVYSFIVSEYWNKQKKKNKYCLIFLEHLILKDQMANIF